MSYPLIRQGDHLPAVGVLQKLLNRTGSTLHVDGIFGHRTKTAVKDFQRPRRLVVDGVVGQQTWPRLVSNANDLNIIDCIDIFDPSLLNLEATDILRVGGNPVLIGGMSNGVEQAVLDIRHTASAGGIFLLRFHGHGASGVAGISAGQGGIPGEHHSSIHTGNIAQMRPIIAGLRSIFGLYGCVQFMHCSTGRGRNGRQLLSSISSELGVPVTAAVRDQLGGGLATFRFEGPTFTAMPRGGTLRSWCQQIPDFVQICVS